MNDSTSAPGSAFLSGASRLDFILHGQHHCDHYLSPLADPSGRSVLVAGCGAGTEMLWCLRRGAKEVVGIDIAPQQAADLEEAVGRFDIAPDACYSIRRLPIEEIPSLGRTFDLVLSNNVFEHVAGIEPALRACLAGVDPKWGRLVIFSAPLFFSSTGSHLDHEPWEHLWADSESLRKRLLAKGASAPAALSEMSLERYFDSEITLNRARFSDFLEALGRVEGVAYKLSILPDRSIHRLAEFESRIRQQLGDGISALDLTIEGIVAELGPARADRKVAPPSLPQQTLDNHPSASSMGSLSPTYRELEVELARERGRSSVLQTKLEEVVGVLQSVETSPTFRAARLFSARLRRLGLR